MLTKITKKPSQQTPLATQARRSVFQREVDKQSDNPLQQSVWQPSLPNAGAMPRPGTNNTGHSFTHIPVQSPIATLQPKLTIGQPDDKYEQEADRVADQVMRMPDSVAPANPPQSGNGVIQRTCATCAQQYDAAVQEGQSVEQDKPCPKCQVQAKPLAGKITPLLQREMDNTVEEEDEDKTALQTKPLIQRQEDEEEKEDEEEELKPIQTSTVPGHSPAVTPGVTSGIAAMRGGGQTLSPATRGFMEPRFGHSFSQVRIHTDSNAARISRQINARAFTVGPNIGFAAGQYQPNSPGGRKLLAHELTHVVQQGNGLVTHRVQRAKINHRNLSWADFKGAVPAGATIGAETDSGFDIPKWKTTGKASKTQKTCRIKNQKFNIFSYTLNIDPAIFGKIKAYMDPIKSWAHQKYKAPKKHCAGLVKKCKAEIAKQVVKIAKTCKSHIKPCKDAFNKGFTYYEFTSGSNTVRVTKKSDCSKKLVTNCKKILSKKQLFEYKQNNVTVVKAVNESECDSKKFKKDCLDYFNLWSPQILKHEQGHFDISNILADKAKADLKKKAVKYTATATGCGKKRANLAALKKFKALNAGTEIATREKEWVDLKDKAGQDYDNDTTHGLDIKKQATWDANIKAGLKAYNLKP